MPVVVIGWLADSLRPETISTSVHDQKRGEVFGDLVYNDINIVWLSLSDGIDPQDTTELLLSDQTPTFLP